MPKVFISYRRENAEAHAGRLGDRIKNKLGSESVFVDVESITPGVNFTDHLKDVLLDCLVIVVVIDKDWAVRDNENLDWLSDSNFDFVAYEIEVALRNNLKMFPVLINSAKMPLAASLPRNIKKLAQHHAANLRSDSYDSDSNDLIFLIENYITQVSSVSGNDVVQRRNSEAIVDAMDFSGSALRFEHVSLLSNFGGRETPVLSDINFGIDSGVMLAVGGAAGSGKTSLLRVGALLQDPSEGSVIIGGVNTSICSKSDVDRIKLNVVRYVGAVVDVDRHGSVGSKISKLFFGYFLIQNFLFHVACYFGLPMKSMPVFDYLKCISKKYGNIKNADDEYIVVLLKRFEMYSIRNERVGNLPLKVLQRLAFVKAFLGEPKVVFVDGVAARNACDANFNVYSKLKQISEEKKITLVIEAPTQKEVQYCNRLMSLEDGAVTSFGVKSVDGWSLARVKQTTELD